MKSGNEKESAKEIFAKLTKEYDENVKKERFDLLLDFFKWINEVGSLSMDYESMKDMINEYEKNQTNENHKS